jgi:hypothetical protein
MLARAKAGCGQVLCTPTLPAADTNSVPSILVTYAHMYAGLLPATTGMENQNSPNAGVCTLHLKHVEITNLHIHQSSPVQPEHISLDFDLMVTVGASCIRMMRMSSGQQGCAPWGLGTPAPRFASRNLEDGLCQHRLEGTWLTQAVRLSVQMSSTRVAQTCYTQDLKNVVIGQAGGMDITPHQCYMAIYNLTRQVWEVDPSPPAAASPSPAHAPAPSATAGAPKVTAPKVRHVAQRVQHIRLVDA